MKNIYITALALFVCGCASPVLFKPAAKGDVARISALLASGADPNEHRTAYANRIALHLAAAKSRTEAVRLLIEHGSDVNAVDSGDGTPLHYAACEGNAEIVQLLLQAGANPAPPSAGCYFPSVSKKDQGTPLQLAEQHGHTMAAQLIRAAIASRLGLTAGSAKNADEYGPIVAALVKGYDGGGRTIAVAGFSYADGRPSSDGDIVTARVTTELIKLKRLTVVERKEIQKMLGELKLQNAGTMDPDSAKKLGKMLGADLLVVGTMAELPGGMLELNLRLAGVESGTAISAVSGQVRKNWLK